MTNTDYDPKTLEEQYQDVDKIAGGLEKLTKDPTSPGALSEMAEIAGHDNPGFYHGLTNPAVTARQEGEARQKEKLSGLETYILHNTNAILKSLDDSKNITLLMSADLKKTGNKEYDEFVDAKSKQAELNKLTKGEGDIHQYVAQKLSAGEDWQTVAYSIMQTNESYVKALAKEYMQRDLEDVNKVFEKYKSKIGAFVRKAAKDASKRKDSNFFLKMGRIAIAKPAESD